MERRVIIERFCNKVTQALYSNRLDPVGLVDDSQRSVLTTLLARDLEELEQKLGSDISCMFTINSPDQGVTVFLVFSYTMFGISFKSLPQTRSHNVLTLQLSMRCTCAPPGCIFASQHSLIPPPRRITTSIFSRFGFQHLLFWNVHLIFIVFGSPLAES